MCYAAPGPRCSAHAKTALDRAVAKETTLSAEVKIVRERFQETGSDEDYQRLNAASRLSLDARRDAFRAQTDYDATPGGIADLKAQLARMHEEKGSAAALTDYEHQRLLDRIADGQRRRAEELAAYKAANHLPVAPPAPGEDHQGDAPEDEESAALPAPKCQCITYKYKGDCEHLGAKAEQDRRTMLPTGLEASMDLHRANAELRQATQRYQAAVAAADEDPSAQAALAGLKGKVQAAHVRVDAAKEAFATTPAGQGFYRQRADEELARMGYNTGEISRLREMASTGAVTREDRATRFASMTGQPIPADDTTGPPDLMYGNGCDCREWQWTGDCVHRNPDRARAELLKETFLKDPQVKAMGRAMNRLGNGENPRGGMLSRLRDRIGV